jgi:hypothetical protein
VGVTPHQGERESRLQGQVAQVSTIIQKGKVCVMQRAEALMEVTEIGHWRAECGENRMLGSVGGCRKRVRIREYLAGSLPCLRRLTRRWITLAEGRGSEGGDLWVAHLTWTRKREGTAAWWGSVEHCEGVDGAAAQGPCDMAKTRLFEA